MEREQRGKFVEQGPDHWDNAFTGIREEATPLADMIKILTDDKYNSGKNPYSLLKMILLKIKSGPLKKLRSTRYQ